MASSFFGVIMNDGKFINEIYEKLLSDDAKVELISKTTTMKEFRKLEEAFGHSIKDTVKRALVFWDDVIQFTTIGLIESILDDEVCDSLENKEWDYGAFFYRPVELTDGIIFTKELFENSFKINLTIEFIKNHFKDNYSKILKSSPVSVIFPTLARIESILSEINFVFRYKFDGIESFTQSFTDHLTVNKHMTLKSSIINNLDEVEFLKNVAKDYDIIMMVNLGNAYIYIEDTKHQRLILMGPNIHNGISELIHFSFIASTGSSRMGPYNSELVIYNEGLALC